MKTIIVYLTRVSASAVNIHKKRSSVSSDWDESDADMTIPLMLERREMRRSQQPGYTSRVQSTTVQTTAVTPYTPGLVRGQESMWRARPMKRMEPSRPAVAVVASTSTLMCHDVVKSVLNLQMTYIIIAHIYEQWDR